AFLDAVRRAGLQVLINRLPPKGITRHVSVDSVIASDIVAFGLGQDSFDNIGYEHQVEGDGDERTIASPESNDKPPTSEEIPSEEQAFSPESGNGDLNSAVQRIVTVVCPGREIAYPFSLLSHLGIETVCVDFGQPSGKEVLQAASRWVDISDSQTIWRED
ncbi:MAG: hypothetical protein KDD60_11335, partial [Bdellovibrionales bacterium]|nr:hypothetical protein [Bdellovibrionales bacterium]